MMQFPGQPYPFYNPYTAPGFPSFQENPYRSQFPVAPPYQNPLNNFNPYQANPYRPPRNNRVYNQDPTTGIRPWLTYCDSLGNRFTDGRPFISMSALLEMNNIVDIGQLTSENISKDYLCEWLSMSSTAVSVLIDYAKEDFAAIKSGALDISARSGASETQRFGIHQFPDPITNDFDNTF